MKTMVDLPRDDAANAVHIPDSGPQGESGWADVLEYWAGRIVWALVIVTSLWDMAVTFDQPVELTARLF